MQIHEAAMEDCRDGGIPGTNVPKTVSSPAGKNWARNPPNLQLVASSKDINVIIGWPQGPNTSIYGG